MTISDKLTGETAAVVHILPPEVPRHAWAELVTGYKWQVMKEVPKEIH